VNLERVVFGFFIILALALNLGFVAGEIDNPAHHNPWLLFTALMVGLITSGLKLGDRSQLGALVLAASLVANLLLMIAVSVWAIAEGGMEQTASPELIVTIVSLGYGALAANVVSVSVLVSDTLMSRR
jgi:hypothetical protein